MFKVFKKAQASAVNVGKGLKQITAYVKNGSVRRAINFKNDVLALRTRQGRFDDMNKIAHSYWYDWVGVAVIVIGAYVSGYFSETAGRLPIYKTGSAVAHMFGPGLLIGVVSLVSALTSLMSDRFESRLSNVGNWIGVPSVILSAFTDYMYGNRAAFLTYSVTMFIQIVAIPVWHLKGRYNVNKFSKLQFYTGLIIASVASFALSYWSNALLFGAKAYGLLFWTTVLVFAISLVANVAEMFKLQFNNGAWFVYDIIQLVKSFVQGNLVNVWKYIYYLGNTAVSLVSWSDKGRAESKAHDAKAVGKVAKA